jgi:hypothetical protein
MSRTPKKSKGKVKGNSNGKSKGKGRQTPVAIAAIAKATPEEAAAAAAAAADVAAAVAVKTFTSAAAAAAAQAQPIIIRTTSNLMTIPPLMVNNLFVRLLNFCLTARDSSHDAKDSTVKPHNNKLFQHAQEVMFGRQWASKCEAAINPTPIITSSLAALEAIDSNPASSSVATDVNTTIKALGDAHTAAVAAHAAAHAAAEAVGHNEDDQSKTIRANALISRRNERALFNQIQTLQTSLLRGTISSVGRQVLTTLSVGKWLGPPETDIIWTQIQHIKQQGIGRSGNVIPRFCITLKPYNLSQCIQAASHDSGDSGDDGVTFLQIIDNSDAGSPVASSPLPFNKKKPQTVRIGPICECYDRAGRSYKSFNRLEALKEWWKGAVTGAAEGVYPPIKIPLQSVGEIDKEGSRVTVFLFLDGGQQNLNALPKSAETLTREQQFPVVAALLFDFYIPDITIRGVPGVTAETSSSKTYVFIHSNGSVTYSDSVAGPNYPDNAEKNLFYSQHSDDTTENAVKQAVLYNIFKSIGDSGAVWCASNKTFIHTIDTGLIARCALSDRYSVTTIRNTTGTHKVLVEPNISEELFGKVIPKSPKLNIDDIGHSPKHRPRAHSFGIQAFQLSQQSAKLAKLMPDQSSKHPRSSKKHPIGFYKQGGNNNSIQSGGESPLKLSSDVCRYFQTLLLYLVSFYSSSRVDDGSIDNFALPEINDVVVVSFTDDVSASDVSNVVANPFQENEVIKPVVKFISFTELPPKIQEFLTFLKAFVKVFVSNIALIANIEIHPKPRVMQDNPLISSAEGDAGSEDNVEMERKLKLICTIISDIFRNNDSGDSYGDGVNEIQTDLRELLHTCLLPSLLLRIDDPVITKGYLGAYKDSSNSSISDSSAPNFFYFPNAASNVFDIVDNIVEYFGPVFSNSYDGDDIVFEKLPVISPEGKAGVVEALDHFKRVSHLYPMPTQIKFNTRAVSSAKIFDNLCAKINGKPLSDPSNATLKEYIEKRLSIEIEKLKTLVAIKKENGESGEGNSSLSEQINVIIEATARDNILREFTEEMMNYYVDDELEDFEKDSMKALIDLNATYGFDVKGNDLLHLNDIIYKIFVQEMMYTGLHIYRVDFLQDLIDNVGFNIGQLNYMDNINDSLAASDIISNEQLTELKIKGYSLSDIIGLLYELRDKTTESSSEEEVTSIISGFFGEEVSSLPKVMKTGIGIGSIPSQPISVGPTYVSVTNGGRYCRGSHKNKINNKKKYDTKRIIMYKKFVSKYIIKADKRGEGAKGAKRRGSTNVTRRKIKGRSRPCISKNNTTRKNHEKNHKKNHKKKNTNTNLQYNLHKRHKTLKR